MLFEVWHRDLENPFAFSSDTIWYLMQSKSTVDNGWWWWNPRLGAPFGLDELAYPPTARWIRRRLDRESIRAERDRGGKRHVGAAGRGQRAVGDVVHAKC